MIEEWFEGFIAEHVRRHSRSMLPNPESEEGMSTYLGWHRNFKLRGINDHDVATAASEQLLGERLRHSSEHFARLVEIAIEIYRTRNAGQAVNVGSDTFEAARYSSANCEHCGGNGLVTVYRITPVEGYPPTVAAHCICLAGRWMRRQIATKDRVTLRRIPDLEPILTGRTGWSAVPLIDPDDLAADFGGNTDPEVMFRIFRARLNRKPPVRSVANPQAKPLHPAPTNDRIINSEPAYARRNDREPPVF